jgi:single-strand DNA-binding protein
MASDINRTILIGRMTKDPELKYTPSGSAVCSFSLACNYSHTSNGEKKEQVSFFNCIAWAKLGEVITQYCKKGHRIAVEGRLQQRSWEKDGTKRSVVEIVVEHVQFLQPRENGVQGETPQDDFSDQF